MSEKEDQGDLDQKEDQGGLDQKEDQGDLDQKEDQGDLDQKEDQGDLDQKEDQGAFDQKEDQGDLDQKEDQGAPDQKEDQGAPDQKEHQGDLDQKEQQGAPDQKEHQGDLDQKEEQADVGDLTENVEYEDDFEKDPECLTDEEEKQNRGERENFEEKEEYFEAQILEVADRFLEDDEEMEENMYQISEVEVNVTVIYSNEKYLGYGIDTEQEDRKSDTGGESSIQKSKVENEQELNAEEDEEIKRYVLGKIEEANKELENQAPVDKKRERKLKFKDEVDPQAPPPKNAEVAKIDLAKGDDVSVGMSRLQISDDTGKKRTSVSGRAGSDEEATDGIETQHTSPKSEQSNFLPTASEMKALPPSDSKQLPDSALNGAKDVGRQKSESANVPTVKSSTYSLTPRQKELRKQIELRNERLKREEEERQREIEEVRRQENEIVFRAWLRKKKEQIREEKRIHRAKQLEELRFKEVNRDPEAAYKLWLKKKHQQYVKERRLAFLRRQAEEVPFFSRAEESDKAFRDWLRRKREEKRAAELAAKERDRQIRLEARRARRMRSIHCI